MSASDQSEHGVRVVRPKAERASQRRLRARKVRGVRCLTPAQLIREAELDEKRGVTRAGVDRCFQSAHPCRADTARRSGERVLGERTGSGGGCRQCRARLGEHACHEAPDGERHRNRATDEECRSSSHGEPRLRPTGVPCGRSPGPGPRRMGTSRGTGCRRSYPRRHPRCCSESGSRSVSNPKLWMIGPTTGPYPQAIARISMSTNVVRESPSVREAGDVAGHGRHRVGLLRRSDAHVQPEHVHEPFGVGLVHARDAATEDEDEVVTFGRSGVGQARVDRVHDRRELGGLAGSWRGTGHRRPAHGCSTGPSCRPG